MYLFVLAAIPVGKVVAAVLVAFIVGLVLGAQTTSHEERALNYNLEDVELDEIHKVEGYAHDEGKAAIAKLKAAAARLKALEQHVIQGIRSRI